MASAPYSRTKVVSIMPRYIIQNNLDFPVIIRQAGSSLHQYFFPANRHETFYLKEIQSEVEVEVRAARYY